MQSLTFQISGISALLVLLNQLWGYAPLERTLVVTVGVGVAVYSVLLVGQTVLRFALKETPDAVEDETALPSAETGQETESGG